jgi:hypothetical protein
MNILLARDGRGATEVAGPGSATAAAQERARVKVPDMVSKMGVAPESVPGMVPAAGPGTKMVQAAKETGAGRIIDRGV